MTIGLENMRKHIYQYQADGALLEAASWYAMQLLRIQYVWQWAPRVVFAILVTDSSTVFYIFAISMVFFSGMDRDQTTVGPQVVGIILQAGIMETGIEIMARLSAVILLIQGMTYHQWTLSVALVSLHLVGYVAWIPMFRWSDMQCNVAFV